MDSWTLLNLSQFVATFSTGLIQRDAPRTGRVHHQWNSPLQIVGQGEWPNPPGFNVRMGARKMSEREPMGTNGNQWEPFGNHLGYQLDWLWLTCSIPYSIHAVHAPLRRVQPSQATITPVQIRMSRADLNFRFGEDVGPSHCFFFAWWSQGMGMGIAYFFCSYNYV